MRLSFSAFVLAFLFCSSGALSAADVDNGSRLAKRWCASCHIVSGDYNRELDRIPSFALIAQRPGLSDERLAYLLLEPHPIMPKMSLSRKEAADIAAYIAAQHR